MPFGELRALSVLLKHYLIKSMVIIDFMGMKILHSSELSASETELDNQSAES